MAAGSVQNIEFGDWLNNKLKELEIDETVFGSYIWGILDSEDSSEEKTEALKEILTEIIENGLVEKICEEILMKWKSSESKEPQSVMGSNNDLNEKLAKLLESQSLATTKQREHTEEEKKLRQAILSQYNQISDSEEEENESGSSETQKTNLEKNVNSQLVTDAEKIKREQSRLESQKKKEKDKQDREKQKNLKEEKKEKRKTQKGERKR